jgi:hypothetical protein
MMKKIFQNDLSQGLKTLFEADEGLPFPVGKTHLYVFAIARPANFIFLKPGDLSDLHNSAFAGIPERDAFSEHYGFYELCNA